MQKTQQKLRDDDEIDLDREGHPIDHPSSLSESTHKEYLALYQESATNLLFAKQRQWRVSGYLTMILAILYGAAIINASDEKLQNFLIFASFLFSASAILMVIFLQFWQINEKKKLHCMVKDLSPRSQWIRGLKSSRESDIHRYIMLFIFVCYLAISEIVFLKTVMNMAP